jgi:putative phage-type endonuclease
MEQNTNEWLKWRKQGVGSSDAGIIMGLSPYKTKLELYNEKISEVLPAQKENFVTEKGHRLEPIARSKHEIMTGKTYSEALIVHEKYPHLRASLDGYNKDDNHSLEIKYMGAKNILAINTLDDLEKLYPHYKAQIQYQMFITNGTSELVMINDALEIKSIQIPVDVPYIENMIMELNGFWECVQRKVAPSTSKDDTLVLPKDKIKLMCKYKKIKIKVDDLEKQLVEIRAELLSDLGKNNYTCDDGSITYSERKGNVNYKAIPELKSIDLEKYRGASSFSWSIR